MKKSTENKTKSLSLIPRTHNFLAYYRTQVSCLFELSQNSFGLNKNSFDKY